MKSYSGMNKDAFWYIIWRNELACIRLALKLICSDLCIDVHAQSMITHGYGLFTEKDPYQGWMHGHGPLTNKDAY